MVGGLVTVGAAVMREVPEGFLARLREFDPALTAAWNARRQRFVIEQCVKHHAPTEHHTHVCERVYVWLVQTEDGPGGGFLSLDNVDHILRKLASIDLRRQGYGPEDHGRFCSDRQYELEKEREKAESAAKELPRLARKDNWLSMNRAMLLLEKHGLRVNR